MKGYFNNLLAQARNNKLLVSNFSYLSILQIFNLILPLVTYPYLVRVLGDKVFGEVIFAFTIVQYLAIFVAYGFNISGVTDVARNANNLETLKTKASVIFFTKTLLFALIALGTILVLEIVEFKSVNKWLIYGFSGICISEIIFPVWFFQGIEKLKFVTIVNVITKSIFTFLTFIVIKTQNDFLYYPLLTSIGYVIGGGIGFIIMYKNFNIRLVIPSTEAMKVSFKESTPLFLSRLPDAVIDKSYNILIGMFIGMKEVGYYDLASKFIWLATMPFMILNQALFPKVAKDQNFGFVKKIMRKALPLEIIEMVVLILLAKWAVNIVAGPTFFDSVLFVQLLSPLIIINANIYLLGSPMLVASGNYKDFSKSVWFAFAFFILTTSTCLLIMPQNLLILFILLKIGTNLTMLFSRIYFVRIRQL